jgi:acyl-CoA dehydrogenase
MVDFAISAEHREILSALEKFLAREVLPLGREHRELLENPRRTYLEDGRFTPEVLELRKRVRMKSAQSGFYSLFLPKNMGGGGFGPVLNFYAYEAIWKAGPGMLGADIISDFPTGPMPIFTFLPKETREKVLPGLMSGEETVCFAFSEADAGSDAWNMRTTAEKRNGKWVINGEKMWISNAAHGRYAVVFAVTDPEQQKKRKGGISAFLVDTADPGFKVDAIIPIMGFHGGGEAIVSLDGVEVGPERLFGKVNEGLPIGLMGINVRRLNFGGWCVGLAKWALDQAIEYSKQRTTFGKPLSQRQTIQLMLADCATQIAMVKYLSLATAWRVEKGEVALKETSMVKLCATEMLTHVADRAIQVHGGMGLTNELKLEAIYRVARILQIPIGTSEIQKLTIAGRLLAGDKEI